MLTWGKVKISLNPVVQYSYIDCIGLRPALPVRKALQFC